VWREHGFWNKIVGEMDEQTKIEAA
jgi:hypothetical protein